MHTNKLFVILAFLTAPQLLSATHSFYVGARLSGCSLTGKRSDLTKCNTDPTSIFADNKKVNARGVYGGVLGGYLFRVENFGIGPELFYNYGKIENRLKCTYSAPIAGNTTLSEITYKATNQVGAHIRLGYFLDSYFLYTLLGMQWQTAYFEMDVKQVDHGAGTTTPYNYKSKRKSTSTFSFGLGVQKAIAENYAVGIECKFATFPNKNFTFTLRDVDRTTLNSSFKYQLRSVALKVMYVF